MKVHEAVTAVKKDVGGVKKDGRNTHQNFVFRGVDAVVNAVAGAMITHGLNVHPAKVEHRPGTMQLSGGKTATAPTLIVDYVFTGPEGDTFTTQVAAEAFDQGDKATAKAMSVAYRTCLLQTFTLPTDDPDPDTHTYERAAAPAWTPEKQKELDGRVYAAKGNAEVLRSVYASAQGAGAPAESLEAIKGAVTA